MKKVKWGSIILCVIVLLSAILVLAGCGGGGKQAEAGSAEEEDPAGPGTVSSSSGIITIDYTENYKPQVSVSSEKLTLWRRSREEGENDHFVEIEAAGTDGSIVSAASVCRSYVQGSAYSMQALRNDLNSFSSEHPSIYTNPHDITLNGETYICTECMTNGAESYKIFGCVSGKPIIISVCDDRDSEEVQGMLNTLRITYAQ